MDLDAFELNYISDLALRRKQCYDGASSLISCRFESDNGSVPQICHARTYVRQWNEMRSRGLGMLFWGPPGTGKTYAAACIANAFLESREMFSPSVIMTNFGVILRRILACTPQDREDYLQRLLSCDLLILDDFGMERQTDYSREQIYNLIAGRCLANKPMVITTNLTLQELRNPQTMAQSRICDRILERCIPVFFDGESLRRANAAANLEFYRELAAKDSANT